MFTAKDLLYKALDYDGFWNTSKQMMNSKPSQLRQLQLEKLFIGFDISKANINAQPQTIDGRKIRAVCFSSAHPESMSRSEYLETLTDLEYFSTGEFISDRPVKQYQHLLDEIISTSKNIFPEQSEIIDNTPVNLRNLFVNLHNFRQLVYIMLNRHNLNKKRIKVFSTEDDYALYLRQNFMLSTDTSLSEIDEILCTLIDPENRTVNKDEIDYPTDDLKIINQEWENKTP